MFRCPACHDELAAGWICKRHRGLALAECKKCLRVAPSGLDADAHSSTCLIGRPADVITTGIVQCAIAWAGGPATVHDAAALSLSLGETHLKAAPEFCAAVAALAAAATAAAAGAARDQQATTADRRKHAPGYVYVLLDTATSEVKIGLTNDVCERLTDAKTYNRHLRVEAVFFALDRLAAEGIAHELMTQRYGRRRLPLEAEWEGCAGDPGPSEWFAAPAAEAVECARDGCLVATENVYRVVAAALNDPGCWARTAGVHDLVRGPRTAPVGLAEARAGTEDGRGRAATWLASDATRTAIAASAAAALALLPARGRGAGAGAGVGAGERA